MKKIILSLILVGLSVMGVEAEPRECTPSQISDAIEDLATTSYDLEYASDYTNRVGLFEQGYMKLTPKGLPSGYKMRVYIGDREYYELMDNVTYAEVKGGVHKIEYYREDCSTLIRSFEMKVPSYKLFCNIDKSCENNVWFDGTYENSASNQNRKPKETVSLRLIIILIVLILIIVAFIVITIKRRRDREKGF